jgi:hypothetical protein
MVDAETTTLETGRNPDLEKTYRNIIKPAILKAGRQSIRADGAQRPGLEGELDGDDQLQIPGFPQLQPPRQGVG